MAEENGINVCGSIVEAVKDVDYVVTCLPLKHHIMGAHLNDDGILPNIKKDCVVMDCSTVTPMVEREISD